MKELESRVRQHERAFPELAEELRLAYRYIHSDAAGSLNKSRIVTEKIVSRIFVTEMAAPPRKPLLGDMLADNQFTRKFERRVLSTMNSIRDMANLGTHGEYVESRDAAKVLDDLCEILDWYARRYAAAVAGENESGREGASRSFEYLLPVFVGHAFTSDLGETLGRAVQHACGKVNAEQDDSAKRFVCVPQFAAHLDHSNLATVLDTVCERIRQSALTIFEVSGESSVNVFLELGIAIGMKRSVVLLARKPYDPPSDLRGYRAQEYSDQNDLEILLADLIRTRLAELSRPPLPDQHVIHQKMQIDAVWQNRIELAEDEICFLAGDVSWASTLGESLRRRITSGVTVRVCCKRPAGTESVKWSNIHKLVEIGTQVKLYDASFDPGLRGFIWEPSRPSLTEAVFVDKQRRRGVHLESSGVTIGESESLYTATISQGQTHHRHLTAVVRLFQHMWESSKTESYPVRA